LSCADNAIVFIHREALVSNRLRHGVVRLDGEALFVRRRYLDLALVASRPKWPATGIAPEGEPGAGSSGHLPLATEVARRRSVRLPRGCVTDAFSWCGVRCSAYAISTSRLCAEFVMLSGRVERPRVRRVSPAPPWYILGYRAIEQDSAKGIAQPSGPPSGARALFAGLCHDRGCVGVERRDYFPYATLAGAFVA
jgi:hypothetical protein